MNFSFKECLNQKKCRARFGLEQQANWCKHCKRKKKCLRYTENESTSVEISSWSDEDDTDDSDDGDVIPMNEQANDSMNFHHYSYLPESTMTNLNDFKREI